MSIGVGENSGNLGIEIDDTERGNCGGIFIWEEVLKGGFGGISERMWESALNSCKAIPLWRAKDEIDCSKISGGYEIS